MYVTKNLGERRASRLWISIVVFIFKYHRQFNKKVLRVSSAIEVVLLECEASTKKSAVPSPSQLRRTAHFPIGVKYGFVVLSSLAMIMQRQFQYSRRIYS